MSKICTNIDQSKVLKEILPLESADMCYSNDGTAIKIDANSYLVRKNMWQDIEVIPCWSLAALLEILKNPMLLKHDGLWHIYDGDTKCVDFDNPVDTCVEMIVKLHKEELL